MYRVVKRDNEIVDFDLSKIKIAIQKAFDACGREDYNDDILSTLALKVSSRLSNLVDEDSNKVHVETIQDVVEATLSETGYTDVAKSYILYRRQRQNLLDYKILIDNYLKVNDWRVKENSTIDYSLGGLILSNSGAVTANYWLNEIYDKEIADAHKNCDLHIHDLSMLSAYCAGWNLKQLIKEGLGGVSGKITSKPASHLSTLCNQMVNFLGCLQNEWAG